VADGRYDTVDSLLREVAYETLPHNRPRGAAPAGGGHGGDTPRSGPATSTAPPPTWSTTRWWCAEAAEALVAAGTTLLQASRHLDALRLLERGLELGRLPSSALLDLARLQAMASRDQDALRTLALIEDDPDDPAVAVERDHTAASSIMFSDPSSALPRLQEAARQWADLGVTTKEAWARGNTGVAYFNLSRMDEAIVELEHALKLFQEIDDRPGAMAASSLMSLAKPTDPRVSGWLAEALEYADAAGDRSKQLNTLTTLTWNHFIRSFCGRASDMAEAERFARRLAELAEDLGARDQAVQGWSLLAVMARLSGRLEEAAEHAGALQRSTGNASHRDPWLGRAAIFSVTVAGGAVETPPPDPPPTSPDPVIRMASLLIDAELTLAGRVDEALHRTETISRPDLGTIADLAQVFQALALRPGRSGGRGATVGRARRGGRPRARCADHGGGGGRPAGPRSSATPPASRRAQSLARKRDRPPRAAGVRVSGR
jgi:tetratricopeptide (TPR) repeat protein